ncbi:MAG: nucleotide sugar dehydrogenase [Planctomycetaceae bacterium]
MRISVFGLGYVGAVSVACLARDGHGVIGVDVDDLKLDLIAMGRSPIVEVGMQELMSRVVASGRVKVTSDADEAIAGSDLSFLCVGTPSQPNGAQDLSAMERLCVQLGAALRKKQGWHAFVVRSTVLPGTVDEVLIPLLERTSGRKEGVDFGMGFQPEFLREASSIEDYDNPPYTVIGTGTPRVAESVRGVFGHLPGEFVVCGTRTAEMLKYCCNSFHALKITFANEIGRVAQAIGVDSHEVMDLVCKDTQLNISRAYLRPGFAFGGSCLPKDLRALNHVAGRHDVQIPMIGAITRSNELHVESALAAVLRQGRKSVGMFGLSFKSGTDDLRESPLVTLAERFIGKGLRLRIYDPDVQLSRLVGANRRYIEESIPHIGSLLTEDAGDVIDHAEVLVVALKSETVRKALEERLRPDQFLLDLARLPNRERLRCEVRGVCW